jgi:hypothetical protein
MRSVSLVPHDHVHRSVRGPRTYDKQPIRFVFVRTLELHIKGGIAHVRPAFRTQRTFGVIPR